MANKTQLSKNEIRFFELIILIWDHKAKFLMLGTIGFIIGFILVHQQDQQNQKFETKFKVFIGHPYVKNKIVYHSTMVNVTLNDSAVNMDTLPYYLLDPKKGIFTVVTEEEDIHERVIMFLKKALRSELNYIKNNELDKHIENIKDINIDDAVESLLVSFNKGKQIKKNDPFTEGIIGIFVGFIIAFFWIEISFLRKRFKILKKLSRS